jgi:diaminopimelate epimerase
VSSRLIKAEGAGNDFLLGIGSWADRLADDADLVGRLCDRRRGLGADGVLAVFGSGGESVRLVHRNADGSPSDFCANGTRCAARAAVELLGRPRRLVVVTGWTEVPAEVADHGVSLVLPPPPPPVEHRLEIGEEVWEGRRLVVGVPHFVVSSTGLDALSIETVGPLLRRHPALGRDGANVQFVEVVDGVLHIRSFERGVEAETLCCGSGVVAAGLLRLADTAERSIEVRARSGDRLTVEALDPPPESPSRLTGPARLVAEIEPFGF